MFKKILRPFEGEDPTLIEKAKILAIMTTVLIAMMSVGVVMNGLEGKMMMTGLNLFFVLLLANNYLMLSRGKYAAASYAAIAIILAAVFTMNFLGVRETPYTIWKLISYNLGAMLICALFINSSGQIFVLSLGSAGFYVLAVVQKWNNPEVDQGLVFFVALYSGVIMAAGIFLINHLYQTFRRHLRASRTAHERSQHNFQLLRDLIDSSSDGLSVGRQLVSTTDMTLEQAEEARQRLEKIVQEIGALEEEVHRSDESYQRIEGAETKVRENMESQTAAVNQSSASVEESAALINSITSSAKEKGELLTKLVQASAEGGDQLEDALEAFRGVNKSSQEIIEVINVIEDIADRTNMLAMNAAIEAAHASDSGRGFAVVAEEIRKLAEETNVNSRQVREILEKNHEQIQKSVNLSEGTGQMFADIHARIEDVDRAIDEILKGLEELSGGTEEITSSVAHLRTTNSEVNTSLDEMREMTDQGQTSVKSIREGSQAISQKIADLKNATEAITEQTHRIKKIGTENETNIGSLQERIQEIETT